MLTAFNFFGRVAPVNAQLNQTFQRVFEEILVDRVARTSGPHGNHSGNHFLTAADVTNSKLAPALNSFIINNITSFPIPTMVPTTTFHMSAGVPVMKTAGLGPIFAEPAETLGKGVLSAGMSFSHLHLSKIRGIRTADLSFAFTHRDLTGDGTLGDFAPESDVFVIDLDMNLNVSISALVATFGLTNALDVGVVVPLIVTELQGDAKATINSFTLAHLGTAVHRFGGAEANPILQTSIPFHANTFGLGDVALRLKYNFLRGLKLNTAAILEMRLPTGNKDNFMGMGETNFKLALLAERRIEGFSPHVNLAFSRRTAGLNNDKLEFKTGFEQRIREGLSLAVDIIGTHDLNHTTKIVFPGHAIMHDHIEGEVTTRVIDLSNIPDRANDNTIDASVGFRFASSERFALLGNLLVPLNDGGLRASFVPTVGFSLNY
jgi:hypothetical protein